MSRATTVIDRVSQVVGSAAAVSTSIADRPVSSSRSHPIQDRSVSVADAVTRLVEQQMRTQYEEHRKIMEALQARMENELLEKQAALLRALRSGSPYALPEIANEPCGSQAPDDLQPTVVPQGGRPVTGGKSPHPSETDLRMPLVLGTVPGSTALPAASDPVNETPDNCTTSNWQDTHDAAVTGDPYKIASSRVADALRRDARDSPEVGRFVSNCNNDSHDFASAGAIDSPTAIPIAVKVSGHEKPLCSDGTNDAIIPTSAALSVQQLPLSAPGSSVIASPELRSDRLHDVGRDSLDSCGEDELVSQSIHVPVPTSMLLVDPAVQYSAGSSDVDSLSSIHTDWTRLSVPSNSAGAALPSVTYSEVVAAPVGTDAIPHLLIDEIARPTRTAVGNSGTCPSWATTCSAAELSAPRGRANRQATEQELLVTVPDLDTRKHSAASPVRRTVAVAAGSLSVKDWPRIGSPHAAPDRSQTSADAAVAEPPAAQLDLLPVPASTPLSDLSSLRTPDEDDDLSTSLRLSLRQKHARQLAKLRCCYEEELDSLRRHMSSHEFLMSQELYKKLLSENDHLQRHVRRLDEELTRAYKYITSVDEQMAALESTIKVFTMENKQTLDDDSKSSSKLHAKHALLIEEHRDLAKMLANLQRTYRASQEALQSSRKDQELLRSSLRKLRAENQFLREEGAKLRRDLKQTAVAPAVISESIGTGQASLRLGTTSELCNLPGTDLPSRAVVLLDEPRRRHIVGSSAARGAPSAGSSQSREMCPRPSEVPSGSLLPCGSTSTSVSYSIHRSHLNVESVPLSVRPATKEVFGSRYGARPSRPAEVSPSGSKRGDADATDRILSPSRSSSARLSGSGGVSLATFDDRGIRGTAVGGSADDEEEEEEEGSRDGVDDDSESEAGRGESSLPLAATIAAAAAEPIATTVTTSSSTDRLRLHGTVDTAVTASRTAVIASSSDCAAVSPVWATSDSAAMPAPARSCSATLGSVAVATGTTLKSQREWSSSADSNKRSSDFALPAGDVTAVLRSPEQQQLQQRTRPQQQQQQTRHRLCPFQQGTFSSPLQPSDMLLQAYSPVATSASPDQRRRSSGSDSDARLGSSARSGLSQLLSLGDSRVNGVSNSAFRTPSCSSTSNCPSSSATSEDAVQQEQQQQQPLSRSDPATLSPATGSVAVYPVGSIDSSPEIPSDGYAVSSLAGSKMLAATFARCGKRSPGEKKAKATQTRPSTADSRKQQPQKGSPARRSLHTSFESSGSGVQLSAVNQNFDQLNNWIDTTTQPNNRSAAVRHDGAGLVHHTKGSAAGTTAATAAAAAAGCTLERVQLMRDLETRLDELLFEKRELEAVLSRMPVSGSTLQDRRRKEEVEEQLDSVDRNLGSVRIALRRYKAM